MIARPLLPGAPILAFPGWPVGYPSCLHKRVSLSHSAPLSGKAPQLVLVIVRIAPEKIVSFSGEKSLVNYTLALVWHLVCLKQTIGGGPAQPGEGHAFTRANSQPVR